ncbi:Hypothetical protein A7982_07594 [Minicystis rosea]|nr:Hypothetical protein A7982_07594 [Minicystis rosea]
MIPFAAAARLSKHLPRSTFLGLAFAALTGCSGPSTSVQPAQPASTVAPSAASPRALPAGLSPARFFLGAWTDGTETERWSFAGATLFGVGFTVKDGRTRSFEAMFIQARGGALRFTARPEGARSVPFPERSHADGRVTFENPAHDFPRRVLYRRDGDGLAARVENDTRGVDFAYRSTPADAADALERADRSFAEDTAVRGLDGWMSWFDREGAMWRDGVGRVQGEAAIRALMAKTLSDPSRRLSWHPTASGLSPARDMGFTVGESTLVSLDGGARRELWHGAYVTVWRAQPDGSWKVLFDCDEPE